MVQTVPGSWACARGRLARSTGLLPMSSSTMTASRNAFLSTACRWVTVATASGWPSRPPLVSRSRYSLVMVDGRTAWIGRWPMRGVT